MKEKAKPSSLPAMEEIPATNDVPNSLNQEGITELNNEPDITSENELAVMAEEVPSETEISEVVEIDTEIPVEIETSVDPAIEQGEPDTDEPEPDESEDRVGHIPDSDVQSADSGLEAAPETMEEATSSLEPLIAEETVAIESHDVHDDAPEISKEMAEAEIAIESPASEDVLENIVAADAGSIDGEAVEEVSVEKSEETASELTDAGDIADEVLAVHLDEDEEVEHHEEHAEIPNYSEFSKEQLVNALEEFVRQEDISSVKKQIGLLRIAYHELMRAEHDAQVTGENAETEGAPQPPAEDQLNIRFEAAFGIYKEKKHRQEEQLEVQKQHNLEAKNAILEELRVLITSDESLKKTYDEFRDLQQKWKDIGVVPRNEVANLWQNYHFLVEKFFDKVRINKELRDLDLKKNLEEKINLCEKAEELLLDSSITRSFKLLQQYHTQWKEIGPVPQESRDEIWERFKSVSEKINKRRRDFYLETKEEQENNLAAKLALCEKIDQLLMNENKSIKDWNTITDQVTELFKLWKSIGPGPKKENDAAWERFKAGIDRFYAEKAEYFGKIKEEQLENYNRKVDICVQAEALKDSTDWKETTNTLIRLQQDWKNTGPVSRKNADKIWKRFRTACDEFFNRKNDYFANIKQHEQDNLNRKKELIQRVSDFAFGDDKSENLKVLKEFQREWIEIGHVPMKEKDALQAAFRQAIDKRMEELQITSGEIAEMNYRSRLDRIMDAPDSNRLMSKERMFLQNKITALQSEINLWENNLGFLAASKKADLLKAEFEAKIKKAKDEVALMKAQLKMLK